MKDLQIEILLQSGRRYNCYYMVGFMYWHDFSLQQGYENLCCLRCIQPRDTNFGTACVCRVPKSKLEEGKIVECVHCGCRGCSG